MIVVVTVIKVIEAKVIFLVFCSDCNSNNRKENKREPVYGKLVGIGSVMDNYAGCNHSSNSYNIG